LAIALPAKIVVAPLVQLSRPTRGPDGRSWLNCRIFIQLWPLKTPGMWPWLSCL